MTEGRQQSNQAVMDLDPIDGLVTTKFDTHLSTLARGYGAGPELALHWTLDGDPAGRHRAAKAVKLDPTSDAVLLPLKPHGPQDRRPPRRHRHPRRRPGRRRRAEDRQQALPRHRRRQRGASVLIVEGTGGTNPLDGSGTFLHMALSPPQEDTGGTGDVRQLQERQLRLPRRPHQRPEPQRQGPRRLPGRRPVRRRADLRAAGRRPAAVRRLRRHAPGLHGRAGPQGQLQRRPAPAQAPARPAHQARRQRHRRRRLQLRLQAHRRPPPVPAAVRERGEHRPGHRQGFTYWQVDVPPTPRSSGC